MKKWSIYFSMSLLLIVLVTACDESTDAEGVENLEYREKMREFVISISQYARGKQSNYIIIPQNGQELITLDGELTSDIQYQYLAAIDATGREDMFYGYDDDNKATPADENEYLTDLCKLFEENKVEVLTTDYCWTQNYMDNSYSLNDSNGFISFAAPERDLNIIPTYPATPYNVNSNDILTVSNAQNFLYLIDSEKYSSKSAFLYAIAQTNYDLVIIDLFFNDVLLTPADLDLIRLKQNGGKRLLICYMSIGEAEDYRFYWLSSWNSSKPAWIEAENPDWEGNYKVQYWQSEWQKIIFGEDNSYLDKIIAAGFNGVYLDIIDAYEYFE